MEKLFQFLDQPGFRFLVFIPIYWLAHISCIPKEILTRAKIIYRSDRLDFACGFLYWYMCVKYNLSIPRINVSRFLTRKDEISESILLIQNSKNPDHSFYLKKQYFILCGLTAKSDKVQQFISFRIKQFFKDHRNHIKKETTLDQSKAWQAMDTILQLNNLLDTQIFLVSGTLLGFVRNEGFLDDDYDIDVGFFSSQVSINNLYKAIVASGKFTHINKRSLVIMATHETGVKVDFFAHFLDNGLVVHGTQLHRWYNSPFTISQVKCGARQLFVPKDYSTYLDENYHNWKKPVGFWDHSFDTPNQVYPNTVDSIFYLLDQIEQSNDRFKMVEALRRLKSNFGIDYTDLIPADQPAKIVRPLLSKKTILYIGVFDTIDSPLLSSLEEAKSQGDRLIAGVVSDQLASLGDPLLRRDTQELRLKLANCLSIVEEAVIFDVTPVENSCFLKNQFVSKVVYDKNFPINCKAQLFAPEKYSS